MPSPSSSLVRVAYETQQLSLLVQATLFQEAARALARRPRPRFPPAMLRELQHRVRALHRLDVANAEAGLYPRALLFALPLGAYARALPRLVRDLPKVSRRQRAGAYRDLAHADDKTYPPYYRRTFHWQTDGYLSEHSAAVYDVGVELLFRGNADVMRRQVLPPITRWQRQHAGGRPLRVLDVACGTGSLLRALATTYPDAALHGIDLSPPYAARAAAAAPRAVVVAGNAEALPYPDASFDVVTSVYLFHELPRNARRRVLAEARRVLRPGGLLVVEDSAQVGDSPVLEPALRQFARDFHEPFFTDYQEDDLAALLEEAGFAVGTNESHLVAKVVAGTRR